MAHIDHLTADVAAPLDRLVDLALQASRTTSLAKQHLLSKFESKASFIGDQLTVIDQRFGEATRDLPAEREQAVDNAAAAVVFLKKLTPHAIGAARSLASKLTSCSFTLRDRIVNTLVRCVSSSKSHA